MKLKNDLYIGNTDHDWFDFCSSKPDLIEVNFWQPSRQFFRAINPGGIFFFRRKSPINQIGGFGILAASGTITIGQAWNDLGVSNGLGSLETFISKVKAYRETRTTDIHTQIGFKIIVEPVFLRKSDWFGVPSDWSPNIVTGKSYSSDSDQGQHLLLKYSKLSQKYSSQKLATNKYFSFEEDKPAGYGEFGQTRARLGQGSFRIAVLGAYENTCAVTGCGIGEALEAAHIVQFASQQDHSIQNGICLRRDIHRLFDLGLVRITSAYKFEITERMRELYKSSNPYEVYDGKKIHLPRNKLCYPDPNRLNMRINA